MNVVFSVMSLAVLISGTASAYYWYKSSKVMIMPVTEENGVTNPIPIKGNEAVWINAVYIGTDKMGGYNKKAAIFTALAVILSTAISLLSLYSSNA